MILESRSIIFSDEELVVALKVLLDGKAAAGTHPKSVKSQLDADGEVAVTFTMSDDQEITLSSREVGAGVLNHCIDVGIPLPRGSYKELAIRGDHVALIVRLETSALEPGLESDED